VVLTTPRLGWPLPTVKGKVVSLYHENPMLLDQAERYVATMNFFYQPLDDLERADIVKRYKASHLLTYASDSSLDPAVADWLSRYATQVAEAGDYRMYAIDLEALPVVIPEPEVSQPADDTTESTDAEPPADQQNVTIDQRGDGALDGADALPEEAAVLPAEVGDENNEKKSFGAPIAEPILDPERHGG
jgi:hypothetical protein